MPDRTPDLVLPPVLRHSPVELLFGDGALARVGELARAHGARSRVLLVTDRAILNCGYASQALHRLADAFLECIVFDEVHTNPTSDTVAAGLAVARRQSLDMIIAIGGGSVMDCAKGMNLLLSCGGAMRDFRGDPPVDALAGRPPLLPMVCVPSTAGSGSEAQSFALIIDPDSRQKMACGDRRPPAQGGLRPRAAILDPRLTWTQPPAVAASAGIDAVSHAVETAATRTRSDLSRELSREAWSRLEPVFDRAMRDAGDAEARAGMLLGAHLAGAAIEFSMLGAAHACANALTALYGTVHGVAVGLMLPHVVRFNCRGGVNWYADLCDDPETLARRLEAMLDVAGLPRSLPQIGARREDVPRLAEIAAGQWTARHNPVDVDAAGLRELLAPLC